MIGLELYSVGVDIANRGINTHDHTQHRMGIDA